MITNHVRGEAWTYLRRRSGHRAAVRIRDTLAFDGDFSAAGFTELRS